MSVRILYIGSTPAAAGQIDVGQEAIEISRGCESLKEEVSIHKPLINRPLREIADVLRTFDPDIVHFGAHGHPNQSLMIVPDDSGEPRAATKEDISFLLKSFGKSIAVVVLNTCYGGPVADQLTKEGGIHCTIYFRDSVEDAHVPEFTRTLYENLLIGTVDDAVRIANMVVTSKAALTWSTDINDPSGYRLFDKTSLPLQPGRMIEGKYLDRRLMTDDLGAMWTVYESHDPATRRLRRFFNKRGISKSAWEATDAELSKVSGVLAWDLNRPAVFDARLRNLFCEHPYVEYTVPATIAWKSLRQMQSELQYPLSREGIDEINRIILRLASTINKAHEQCPPVVHGRLNEDNIIVVTPPSLTTSIFGRLCPIITDFGLQRLSQRHFKNTSMFASPASRQGSPATTECDLYSLLAIWFWLLTGRPPSVDTVDKASTWKSLLDNHLEHKMMTLIVGGLTGAEKLRSASQLLDILARYDERMVFAPKVREVVNSLGMKFTYVGRGEYPIGSSHDDPTRQHSDLPKEAVFLESFHMAQTVVTVDQLRKVAVVSRDSRLEMVVQGYNHKNVDGNIPFTEVYQDGSRRPLSCQFASIFCDILSSLPEEMAGGRKYFLPLEQEWEVACRADTVTAFNTGRNELQKNDANCLFDEVTRPSLGPVDAYLPNAWSLYGMHGNVWEFCCDYEDGKHEARHGGVAAGHGSSLWQRLAKLFRSAPAKVIRGGDFNSPPRSCRSASRAFVPDTGGPEAELHEPDGETQTVGIRLVMLTPEQMARLKSR